MQTLELREATASPFAWPDGAYTPAGGDTPPHLGDAARRSEPSRSRYRSESEAPAASPPPTGPADEALVRRVRHGDEAAFQELVRRYQSAVFSIAWSILHDPNDVEDVAQQVFAKVFFSIGGFDFRSTFYTWLYKITLNECYDFLRRRRARRLVYESELAGPGGEPVRLPESAPDAVAPMDERLEQRDLAVKLLEKLPPEERTLLLLKEVEGRSIEELAAMTGLNENTVKVKLLRARRKAAKAARRLYRGQTAAGCSLRHPGCKDPARARLAARPA